VRGVLGYCVGGSITEVPLPGDRRVGREVGELDGERPDSTSWCCDKIGSWNGWYNGWDSEFIEFIVNPAVTRSDFEPSRFAPARSPAVFAYPVSPPFVLAPADDDNGMVAPEAAPGIFVDTTRIVAEILVHGKCADDRPSRQCILDCCLIIKGGYSVPFGYAIDPAATGIAGRVLCNIGVAGLVHCTMIENPVEGTVHFCSGTSPAPGTGNEVLFCIVWIEAGIVVRYLHPGLKCSEGCKRPATPAVPLVTDGSCEVTTVISPVQGWG